MALRAVPDHPKFAELMAVLRRPKYAALGILEGTWHFTGRFAPQGNIGKYSDQAIETWVGWNGHVGAMIQALIESRWIDRDENHRLLVHDWAQHADKATKNALMRAKLQFCSPAVRTAGEHYTYRNLESGTASRLPEPEPVPGPVPCSKKEPPKKSVTPGDRGDSTVPTSGFPAGLSELQYAAGILEHCAIVDTFKVRDPLEKAIILLAKLENWEKHEAAEEMEARIVAGQVRGETINAFWFEDSRWKSKKPKRLKEPEQPSFGHKSNVIPLATIRASIGGQAG